MAEHPGTDDDTTTSASTPRTNQLLCPICWTAFAPAGRQRYCTDTCRKTAWRRHRATSTNPTKTIAPQPNPGGDTTIYTHHRAVADADARNAVANAVPPGGAPADATAPRCPRCPHCRQPVTVISLLLPPAAAHVTVPDTNPGR